MGWVVGVWFVEGGGCELLVVVAIELGGLYEGALYYLCFVGGEI